MVCVHYEPEQLQEVTTDVVIESIIIWTEEMYFMRRAEPSEMHPDVVNKLMELYIDYLEGKIDLRHHPLVNFTLIEHAIQQHWTLKKLVWMAIAIHYDSLPMFYALLAATVRNSEGGTFQWSMPIVSHRRIFGPAHRRHILLDP